MMAWSAGCGLRAALCADDGGPAGPAARTHSFGGGELAGRSLLVLPYLVLGFIWAFSNPPDAAPDEHDHLIKALGAGRLDLGVPFAGQRPTSRRRGPKRVDLPDGHDPVFACPGRVRLPGFSPGTDRCLPTESRDRRRQDPGRHESAPTRYSGTSRSALRPCGPDPGQAFILGRLVSLLMSSVFLLRGVAVGALTRRGALLGLAVALAPMVVFSAAWCPPAGWRSRPRWRSARSRYRHPPAEALADRAALTALAVSTVGCCCRGSWALSPCVGRRVALSRGGGKVVWRELRRGGPR